MAHSVFSFYALHYALCSLRFRSSIDHPCLCLCLLFSQMTLTIPLRRTILHLLHIFFTDALTFIFSSTFVIRYSEIAPRFHSAFRNTHSAFRNHLVRYTILPRDKSYGESSTVTISPAKILIKCMRILPETWAKTICLFSNSTRNIALGNVSTTFP